MKKWKEMSWVKSCILAIVIVIGLFAIAYYVNKWEKACDAEEERLMKEAKQKLIEEYHAMGREAYKCGIPANANPFIGMPYHSSEAVLWLEGYMMESKSNPEEGAHNASRIP